MKKNFQVKTGSIKHFVFHQVTCKETKAEMCTDGATIKQP